MLPSQTARPKSARSHMYRRKRRSRWPALLALAALLGSAVAILNWWPGARQPSSAIASPGSLASAATPKPASSQPPSPPAQNPKPAPASPAASPAKTPVLANADPARHTTPPKDQPPPKNPPPQTPPSNTAAPPSLLVLAAPPPTSSSAAGNPTAPSQPNPALPDDAAQRASHRIKTAADLIAQNKPLEARRLLSAALQAAGLSPAEADRIRIELGKLNDRIIFGPGVIPGDNLCDTYTVQAGDALSKLPRKLGLHTDFLLIKRINNIADERRIRVGQKLKVIKGTFHAIVHKHEFRLDLYLGDPRRDPDAVFIKSFRVGLGEHDATPEGLFAVKPHSKLINPAWANPRTGESFDADDPDNPLGEYWIGLVGAGETIRGLEGYGIHGTIEPQTIGQMKSMGCIRMLHNDVALLYELLVDSVSTVEVRSGDHSQ